ncbi:MAG: hypothetical protein HY893_02200 [Deltaproteobacteria bacterium]|nr:hypothetical protein [Deltaproteobacteria bacterium]
MLKGRKGLILAILVCLWAFGSLPVFKAEITAVKLMRVILSDSAERQRLTIRSIDELSEKAASLTPTGSTVYFFNPSESKSPEGSFISGKAAYYLYPRNLKVIEPGARFEPAVLKEGDYIMLFFPPSEDPSLEAALASALKIDKVYGRADEKGAQALYRVAGAGAR